MINRQVARARAAKLREVINHHRYLYHVLDREEISEAALDSLKHELAELEKQYPELVTPDSPTQRVAGGVLKEFKPLRHTVPQWSFNDAFTPEEMREFDARMKKISGTDPTYVSELKIDGFKIVLTYKDSLLVSAATRGDGRMGEDVTANVKTIEAIPLVLERKNVDLVVEGEIWLGKKELERINNERKAAGEPTFANPRNCAAGTIRQLNTKIVASRRLSSFAYDIAAGNLDIPPAQTEELELLKTLGFKVNPHYKYCQNIEEVIEYWQRSRDLAQSQDYGVDGVVVKVNERRFQEVIGYTGKAPRFAVAFKYPAEEAATMVEDIVLQVGRTGVITPVALLKPVLLAGSVVSRATLHNEDEIKRLDVRVGDTVVVRKAGDIIPDILSVLVEFRTGKEKSFIFPTYLEACGGPIERIPGQAAHRCVNKSSFAQVRRKFHYFAGKSAFDIEGLGPKIVDLFLTNQLVTSYADFFTLKKGDLLNLPRMGEKLADKILASIEKSRNVTLPRFLIGLSIPNVGEETATLLARRFRTLDKLIVAREEELAEIDGVGPIVAAAVANWFRLPEHKRTIKNLLEQIKLKAFRELETIRRPNVTGKTFVFTGTLTKFSRPEAKQQVQRLGGKVGADVSGATDYLVAGSEAGSKLERAQSLGVTVLTEAQFLQMVK